MTVTVRKVGVIGSGQMGNGIAHVAALAGFEVVLSDHLEREVPVIAIGDHKFYFIQIGSQQIKIRPMISFSLARAGTLDVQNYLRPPVHFRS